MQAVLKAKSRKLWSNVRSIFSSGQNQEGTVLYSIYTYHTQALKGGIGVSREEDNALQKIIRIIIRIIIITKENY